VGQWKWENGPFQSYYESGKFENSILLQTSLDRQAGVRKGPFTVLDHVTTEGTEGIVTENNFFPGNEDRKWVVKRSSYEFHNSILYDPWIRLHTLSP
jgi:hypothetical protein